MGRKINDMTGYTRGRIKVIERVGKIKAVIFFGGMSAVVEVAVLLRQTQ